MEAANNLYGVTMEQPGISQLVAVRFTEEDESDEIVKIVHDEDTDAIANNTVATEPTMETLDDLPQAVRERIEESIPSTVDPDKGQ